MTYWHRCHTFRVHPDDSKHWAFDYLASCSCGWLTGGWTTRAHALSALGRHLEKTADA